MSKTAITSPELAPPVGPYSQAVDAGGFIYFSGQVGQDPTTGKLVAGGIAAETDRVFPHSYMFADGVMHPGDAPGLGDGQDRLWHRACRE